MKKGRLNVSDGLCVLQFNRMLACFVEHDVRPAFLRQVNDLRRSNNWKKTIHEYIHYYNHERIQGKLKGLSSVNYRTQSLN